MWPQIPKSNSLESERQEVKCHLTCLREYLAFCWKFLLLQWELLLGSQDTENIILDNQSSEATLTTISSQRRKDLQCATIVYHIHGMFLSKVKVLLVQGR